MCRGSSSLLLIFFFFLSSRFPSFFFFGFFFFFFGFVVFCYVYFEIECKRLEIYVAKTCPGQQVGSKSASRKRVFKTRVLYGTRVSKTQDASLQMPFIPVLTYYILSFHCASLQISSTYHYFFFFFFSSFLFFPYHFLHTPEHSTQSLFLPLSFLFLFLNFLSSFLPFLLPL